MRPMKQIVIEAHQSNYPDPIGFEKGERLVTGKRDTEFQGWIWVTTGDGNQGWAPVDYLDIDDRSGDAVSKFSYTAKELNTCPGEMLTLHYVLNAWGWVENKDGDCGWVPMKTIRNA
jgi:variant SH3 domain-containing protein